MRNLPFHIGPPFGSGYLLIDCKFLTLQVFSNNASVKHDGLTSKVIPAFNYVFEYTFPDNHGLRARLVEEGCRIRVSTATTNRQHYLLMA